jgi:glycosyltransferase involved in cell wall biosynthesis
MKRILFTLINMNLGGTEKSFLNLLDSLPKDIEIDLLLLKKEGLLIEEVPSYVKIITLENEEIINEYLKKGSRQFGNQQLLKGKFILFLRCYIQFILDKLGIAPNPYWAIQTYIKPILKTYDVSIAYAGIHNFIAYYTLQKTKAEKKVLWIHFDVNKVLSNTSFAKRYYPLFNTICCVSDNAKKEFDKMFPYVAHKSVVFENIVSSSQTLKMAENGAAFEDQFDGLRIVTLGRLSEEKGQQMIPGVVKKLKSQNIKFKWYLIGDGKLRNQLEDAIKKDSLQDHLVLLGSKLNPYAYVRDCDIYVQTSLHEGYCITLKEAQILKRPIVTTNFLSASNLINHNVDGFIVDINEEAIYKGAKLLLENKELRDRFSNTVYAESTNQKMLDFLK